MEEVIEVCLPDGQTERGVMEQIGGMAERWNEMAGMAGSQGVEVAGVQRVEGDRVRIVVESKGNDKSARSFCSMVRAGMANLTGEQPTDSSVLSSALIWACEWPEGDPDGSNARAARTVAERVVREWNTEDAASGGMGVRVTHARVRGGKLAVRFVSASESDPNACERFRESGALEGMETIRGRWASDAPVPSEVPAWKVFCRAAYELVMWSLALFGLYSLIRLIF